MTVLQRLEPGIAILDCGATDSFGGSDAIEAFATAYYAKWGETGLEVDTQDRPTYMFGDGKTEALMSRADLSVWVNGVHDVVGVHVVDSERVPLLLGMGALRKFGITVDFSTGFLHPSVS